MTWTTNPTELTKTEKEMMALWVGKEHSFMALGAAFTSDGRRVDASFQPDAKEMMASAASGSHPAIAYEKMKSWLTTHEAHQRTHLGHVSCAEGIADVWFCQKDNAICFDNQS